MDLELDRSSDLRPMWWIFYESMDTFAHFSDKKFMYIYMWLLVGLGLFKLHVYLQKPEINILYLTLSLFILFSETVSLTEATVLFGECRWPASSNGLPIFPSPQWWCHKYMVLCLAFYISAGNLNPHVCPTNA